MRAKDGRAFGEVFARARAREDLSMREISDATGVSLSYIHGIEQKGLLPSREKLNILLPTFQEAAEKRGVDNPGDIALELTEARERTSLIERAGVDPEMANLYVALTELDGKRRQRIVSAIGEIVEVMDELERDSKVQLLEALRSQLEEFRRSVQPSLDRRRGSRQRRQSKAIS